MKSNLLGLLAETSIHPGSGQDAGFVDLPVAREAATDYPVIVGSSFKGALLDRARADGWDKAKCASVFGVQESAGKLIVSDVRLVALPIRCLTGIYKWTTCPHLLERLGRDLKRTGGEGGVEVPWMAPRTFLGTGDDALFLEERQFTSAGTLPENVLNGVSSLVAHPSTRSRLTDQLVILHNNDFAWFARYGLAINARNFLDNEKKTSKNLWYEETIPSDSLFYCLLADRNGGDALDQIGSLFQKSAYIHVGGNQTIGQGWFAIQWNGPTQQTAKGGAA